LKRKGEGGGKKRDIYKVFDRGGGEVACKE